ncbi:MAG: hypothetical protein MPW15_09220 [Candidatus Manganitrophus sp.]|nr:hypothetical protein [Candidatus Manganitrophus sp.]
MDRAAAGDPSPVDPKSRRFPRDLNRSIPSKGRLQNSSYKNGPFLLQTGETFSKEALIERLYQGGYEVVGSVTQPGELAFRGGIVDLYPPTSPRPIRIEFFGDEIESIRTFDPESQKSIGPAESVEVILGRENLFDPNFYRISLTEYLSPTHAAGDRRAR